MDSRRCKILPNRSGFTLIETILVILIIGIIATVATMKMGESVDTARYESTRAELDFLASAIIGNPDLYADGHRVDFGYVGDIGALPPNLDALVTNPGGYSTWDGPYITRGINTNDFKEDAWNTTYTFSGTTITSTGSGSNLEKQFAPSSGWLLANNVSGYVVDAGNAAPGAIYKDSLSISLSYPNGSGGTTNVTTNPDADGQFSFSSIPTGHHQLRLIFVPDTDTVTIGVTVEGGREVRLSLSMPADLW